MILNDVYRALKRISPYVRRTHLERIAVVVGSRRRDGVAEARIASAIELVQVARRVQRRHRAPRARQRVGPGAGHRVGRESRSCTRVRRRGVSAAARRLHAGRRPADQARRDSAPRRRAAGGRLATTTTRSSSQNSSPRTPARRSSRPTATPTSSPARQPSPSRSSRTRRSRIRLSCRLEEAG